jgi:XTP/dITP diphosphohydrolase
MPPALLLATRNADKLREIGEILAGAAPTDRIVTLRDLGITEHPAENELEAFDTFEENAIAKARYFAARAGVPTLADDSGLCVDALDGAPGVHSKRFSGRSDLRGVDLDAANNATLLHRLDGVPAEERTAHYVCVVALATPDGGLVTARGECHGVILREARGAGGFGYDPLFFLPDHDRSFGEVPREEKNLISHRARAVRGAARCIREILLPPSS